MIGIFSVFDVMESYGDFMEEIYNSSVYKITWMLVVTFPALHIYFIYIYIYIKHVYFASLMKCILKLL
jgi:hypothetical protein